MSWLALAKARFSENRPNRTDKTDEMGVLSVSSVPTGRIYEFPRGVSSVGVTGLFENCISADELIEAAMRACDAHGDGEAAREQMRIECLEIPPNLRADLLDYFRRTYPKH